MSNYFNYNENQAYEMQTVNDTLVYKVKHFILTTYKETSKNFTKSLRKRGSQMFKRRLLDYQIPKAYKEAAKEPIDENKVVFVEVRHTSITNSLQVMFDELANNYDYTIHTHFLLNNNTIRADYTKRCLDAVRDIATAKYVFVDEASNALSAMPLRDGTKVIQLWHGCGAFKKFGFSTADLIFGDDRKEQLKHPFYKNYSLVTVSSPEVIWAYKEAMNIDENSDIVQATGSSRTDIFYDDEFISSSYEHLYEVVPQAKGKKVILYAPTFRGRVAKAEAPNMLNVKMFYEAFGDDYVLLFKYHPLVKEPPVVPDEYKHFAMDVGSILSIEELLSTSDVCISDYSSLVFEYSLFEKPLIFFAYDLDEYFDWRGFYYDYFELAPGLIAKTNFEMIDYIKNIDTRFDRQAIIDFREKFMRSCDGNATQRILEYAFDDLEKHKKPCEKFEHFYTVPKVESSLFPYYKRVKSIAEQKELASDIYKSACKNPVKKGSVVALDIASSAVNHILKKNKITNISDNEIELEGIVKALAEAEYIIIDHLNSLLDSLEIRNETKVILIPDNAFPLTLFGKNTKEFRSGLKKEQYSLAPLYNSVKAIASPSESTAELFKTAFIKNVDVINVGDLKSDVLFDKRFKTKVQKKLYEAYPKLEGRKIISYISTGDSPIDDSAIYEYLYKDYVLLKYRTGFNTECETLVYYEDSIVDVTGVIDEYELLAISDIAIGDLNSSVLSFMATGKPVFIYCPNSKQALIKAETFFDAKDACPTPIYEDVNDIIKVILNIDSYDYSKYNELKNKYLTNCDGKSAKRLFDSLK